MSTSYTVRFCTRLPEPLENEDLYNAYCDAEEAREGMSPRSRKVKTYGKLWVKEAKRQQMLDPFV